MYKRQIFNIAKPYINKENGGAVLRGINMEGPFFNKAKKGAQAEKYICLLYTSRCV